MALKFFHPLAPLVLSSYSRPKDSTSEEYQSGAKSTRTVPSEKKILVDLLNLATPQIAGVGVFTKNLMRYWLLEHRPYKIVCYSSAAIDSAKIFELKISDQVAVRTVNAKHVLARLLYQQLILPFVLRKYDLYFNPAVGLPFLSRIFAPKTKLVVTIHDMAPFVFRKKYSRLRTPLVKILSKYAAQTAHRVVTVSENSKRDIEKFAHVSLDKIQVIYNFIPPPYELNNVEDQRYFLCISTIEPGKNLEKTLQGFSRFITESGLHQYKFYWIGRIGWVFTEQDVINLVKENQVTDNFVFLGYLPEAEKVIWIRNCTAIVYLSFHEGFGLPVLEGMTFNKPSLVSNVSSLPEVVGTTGITCDPNDDHSIANGLKELIVNRKNLTINIPDQLRKFDPHTQIGMFIKMIDTLLFGK